MKLEHIDKGNKFDWGLDLGTGTGVLPQNMYNKNAKIIGIDSIIFILYNNFVKKLNKSGGYVNGTYTCTKAH